MGKIIDAIRFSFEFLFTKKYEKKTIDKKSAENLYLMILGMIVGILGSVIASITITAMYRIIDKNPEGHNWITFLAGIIGISLII